jgi:hypothetical protein
VDFIKAAERFGPSIPQAESEELLGSRFPAQLRVSQYNHARVTRVESLRYKEFCHPFRIASLDCRIPYCLS